MDEKLKEKEMYLTARRWKHRRVMSYISLLSIILITLTIIVLAATENSGDLSDFNSVILTSIGGFVAVIGAYMGLSTMDDIFKK